MPKLGAYEYPEHTLTEAVALGQRIAREFAGEVSRHALASALGMSERGGAFASRLGALRAWGVAAGRSRIRVTREGLRAASPLSPQEAESARKALAASVPLFVELTARTGAGPHDESRLAILLEDITGAGRQDILARLATLDRVYSEAKPYLADRSGPSASVTPASQSAGSPSPTTAAGKGAAPSASARQQDQPAGSSGASSVQAPAAVNPLSAGAGARRASPPEPSPDRIELVLPNGVISLPETVTNIDAMLTVLWAHRQVVAAQDARAGRPSTAPAPDFVFPPGMTAERQRPP
jgi:hypothetical protein